MAKASRSQVDRPALFAAALLVAVGGLVYELILGTAASYLFGDSVVSFSIATGVTLFGMGVGSLLAGRFARRAGRNFAWNEIMLGFIGGNSVLLLFAAFSLTQLYWLVFVLLSLIIGIFIGLEIPLLIALFQEHKQKSDIGLLGRVLAIDYFGALIASLLFPFVLLPQLGLMRTAYAVAFLNVAVAIYILWRLKQMHQAWLAASAVLLVLLSCFIFANKLERSIDARAYQDPVVYYNFSPYQKIVVTQYKQDRRLYLNNQLQFSSLDEARYHETLAHAAMTTASQPKRVLILGGGDGMLAREVLKYRSVEVIDLIDIDPKMTDIATHNQLFTVLNRNALGDARVKVHNQDAFTYVKASVERYDVIIADLVDPAGERVAKLYSQEFYRAARDHLSADGVFITQATSSYFTNQAFSTVAATVKTAMPDKQIVPLTVNVPSFGEWGFVLAAPLERDLFDGVLPAGLQYVTNDRLRIARQAASIDTSAPVSTLLHPTIYTRYQAGMSQWRYE